MEFVPHGKPDRPTQWCVITGAPSSGKTAVIAELERRGCRVVHEAARAYIEEELEKGRTLQQVKADPLRFERCILLRKVAVESRLPSAQRVFLDRALPDSIAYFRFEGLDSSEPEQHGRLFRYHRIFFFERLQLAADPVRSENEQGAEILEELLDRSYRELGYDLIRVPVMPVEDRTQFVLSYC